MHKKMSFMSLPEALHSDQNMNNPGLHLPSGSPHGAIIHAGQQERIVTWSIHAYTVQVTNYARAEVKKKKDLSLNRTFVLELNHFYSVIGRKHESSGATARCNPVPKPGDALS